MRHPVIFSVLLALGLALGLALRASSAAEAQDFYGTGSSYTGQKVPIQTLNAINAEKRNQTATENRLLQQRQQMLKDQKRALTSGPNLDCQGKTASTTTCASKPLPEFDRRAQTLDLQSDQVAREHEEKIKRLQNQQ